MFLEIPAGIAWIELALVSIAEIAEKVDLPLSIREEFPH